jgi:hypothetical protein
MIVGLAEKATVAVIEDAIKYLESVLRLRGQGHEWRGVM